LKSFAFFFRNDPSNPVLSSQYLHYIELKLKLKLKLKLNSLLFFTVSIDKEEEEEEEEEEAKYHTKNEYQPSCR
jgi:hypothetical protein